VTCRGTDGFGVTDYWQNCINIAGISNVNFYGVSCLGGFGGGTTENGIGINIAGTASLVPVQFNVFGGLFSNLNEGIVYGDFTQGLSVSGSNFTNCSYGIHAPPSLTGLDQLSVSNSQFNCFTCGIRIETELIQTQIVGNVFLVESSSTGVFIDRCLSTQIIGNSFGNSGGATANNGVQMITYVGLASVISGNTFCQLTTGINLAAGSQFVNVQSNAYSGNTNNVLNSGANNTLGGVTGATN
jgi:nitrous oxidase accessory protein NosD